MLFLRHSVLVINSNISLFTRYGHLTYTLKFSIENCGQTVADGDIVTIDSQ